MSDACKSCEARIIWAVHERTGQPAPFDVEPTPDGRWHIAEQLSLDGSTDRTYKHGEPGGHTNHFATCPFASTHRKPQLEGA